ncbi:hypothetical protein I5Q34_31660 [Streptomyces sp. AV19]|uniref:hypothetical protein n=1 Tax=Streptomyces sp. AV19 TaxID=2793068 RepID=UPI0018FE562C|nr:hypothetical protein [Streptomyces sp. AV19]MBH1938766.1 hypothetical protein [Streptomyces sp. AV19]MDG4533957.1 hypothetical protein [Streptomyces sp. AV19]
MSDLRPAYRFPRPLVGVTRLPDTTPHTYRTCPKCLVIHKGIGLALRARDQDTADRLRAELGTHQQSDPHKEHAP